jgi:tRNA(Arg) A34 adenosine deaminase TadA
MRNALDVCRRGIAAGQSPFGAAIVREGEVLAAAHNRVWAMRDPTAHAEITAIREAAAKLGTIELAGATIYSTTEPCPMCFGAIHWARIARIVYGARIDDARGFGFNELALPNRQLKELSCDPVELVPDVLREESLELFRLWATQPGNRAY